MGKLPILTKFQNNEIPIPHPDNQNITKLLIEYGADINAKDKEEWTPLHWSAYRSM